MSRYGRRDELRHGGGSSLLMSLGFGGLATYHTRGGGGFSRIIVAHLARSPPLHKFAEAHPLGQYLKAMVAAGLTDGDG